MFACKDFKELGEGPSGTRRKVAGGKKEKSVSVTLMPENGVQNAEGLNPTALCVDCKSPGWLL